MVARLERRSKAHDRDVGIGRMSGAPAVGELRGVQATQVGAQRAGDGQSGGVAQTTVVKDGDRPGPGALAQFQMLAQRQRRRIGSRRGAVLAFQSQCELDDPCRGIPETLLGHAAVFNQGQQQRGVALAAELVDACREQPCHTPCGIEVLDAPCAGRERLAEHHSVVHQTEVAEDQPVEPELVRRSRR